MQMPVRTYAASNSSYRYGFNGKEKDNEVKGEGNQYDYGWRGYDPRIGRFLSFDPLHKEYNDLSPYHFAGNNPIRNLDRDGGEPLDFSWNWQYRRFSVNGGKMIYSRNVNDAQLGYIDVDAVYDKWSNKTWFIHQGNDGKNYYWKHNPGADQTVRMVGNGKWEPFETQEAIQAELGAQSADALSLFFAVNVTMALTGGTGYMWLAEDALEELAGVPLPDGPLDLIKYEARRAERKAASEGLEFADDAIRMEASEGRRILNKALTRQNLAEIPKEFKEKWSEGGYDFEVRIHGPQANAPAGSNSATTTTYIVSRRLQGKDVNGQGYGWERFNEADGKWYKEKDLKLPANNSAANGTHNPL